MEEACKRRSAKKLNDDDEKNVSRNSKDKKDDGWKAIETEYLECSTILRRIIPARARSMWIVSDFLYYTFSSVGREEKRAIEKAKVLAEIAVETCTENSALREIIRGEAHGKRATDAVEEATTLLFAGHDTQSATMCWGILELIKHEKIQEELRRSLRKQRRTEIEENGGRQQHRNSTSNEEDENENDDDVNDDDADEKEITTSASKPELEAVIRETLRLHPVAPLVVRQMKHRSIHLENGVTIPKGTAACVWLHASHRDPAAWESPNAFQPSRWHDTIAPATTTTTIKLKKPGKNFQPFASGQRSCVGQHVAMATLRVVFGQLLETFTFSENASEYPIADEMVPSVGFTVAPRFGARVNVSEEEED
jgi:cytochrome P450